MFTGNSNVDTETGIHYGMISRQSLADWVLDSIFQDGEDLHYQAARTDLIEQIELAVRDWYGPDLDSAILDLADACLENYESDGDDPRYLETEGIIVQTSELGVWVFESPLSRMAPVCSPCVPGAGDLDAEDGNTQVLTYTLPLDWLREDLREREQRLMTENGSKCPDCEHSIEGNPDTCPH